MQPVRPSPTHPPPAAARHDPTDWLLLAALTILWGSSFLFTKLAVGALAFEQVVSARLLLAALLLVPLAAALGRPLPRGRRTWGFFALIALVGHLLPFSLITWGQRGIDSGLTGILMAVMPLATLGLAHFLVPGERLTRRRVTGFLLGFAGVLALLGPATLGVSDDLPAMLAVLTGALCYGVSSILARLQPARDALSTAAAVIALAALVSLPAGLAPPLPPRLPVIAIVAVLFLGVFATATATILYFRLIRSAGPGFTSQLNYLIPVWAVGIGVLFLGEEPGVHHLAGLLLILSGILVARRGA